MTRRKICLGIIFYLFSGGGVVYGATPVNSCPTNTSTYTLPTGAVTVSLDSSCPTGYVEVFRTTGCSDESGTNACEVCPSGTSLYNDNTCVAACTVKSTARLTGGAVIPLWATLVTAHGLHVSFGNNNICHINMGYEDQYNTNGIINHPNTIHVKTSEVMTDGSTKPAVYSALGYGDPSKLGSIVCMREYKVQFNCGMVDDANVAGGTPPANQSAVLGQPFTVPDYGTCELRGYNPTGWRIYDATYASNAPTFIWSILSTQSTSITAKLQWAVIQYTYRYLCDVGGTVVKTDTVNAPSRYTVNYTGCTKTGYSFANWGISTSSTVAQNLKWYNNTDRLIPMESSTTSQDLYFIANWKPNKYRATFSCNGGAGTAPSNQNVLYNDTMTLPNNTCSRTDYWFTGWTQNNGTTYYQPGDTYTWNVASNQTFNAGWMKRYDAGNGGSASSGNTTNNTWTATFSYGTVNGTSRCSSTGGNFSGTALPDSAVANDGGKWCWCKMAINNTSLESGWVPLFGYSADITENASADAAMCAANCATHCGYMMANYESLRGTMYASVHVNQPLAVDYSENSIDKKYECNDLGYGESGYAACKDTGLTNGGAAGTWTMQFSYGTVSGIASCNSISGNDDYTSTAPAASMNSNSTGQYCWCKPTVIANESTASAPWVYHSIHNGADDCAISCAYACARSVAGAGAEPEYRGALYTAAGIANSN